MLFRSGPVVTGLSAGNYTVSITDANGCTTSLTTSITQPGSLSATTNIVTNVSCFGGSNGAVNVVANGGTAGYTYSWSPSGGNSANATGLTAGNYSVTITDANGCSTTSNAIVNQPTLLTSVINNSSPVLCNGGSTGSATVLAGGGTPAFAYSWSPAGGNSATGTGLAAGNYIVTVTDANGCTASASTTISQPVPVTVSAQPSPALCSGAANGSVTASAVGGVQGFSYSWTPVSGNNSTLSGLTAGNYTVTATDANGCSATASAVVTQPTPLIANASVVTNVSCFGGSNGAVNVVANGGTAGYAYSWSPSGGNSANATGLTAGNYSVTITDANGCSTTANAIEIGRAHV